MELKKNISLILGIFIPILMILLVAGSIYLPGLFIHPHTNFLYLIGNNDYYDQREYTVKNNKLVKLEIKRPKTALPPGEIKFFIYNVTQNENKEISFAEAQKLNLDSSIQSPDGFTVVYGNKGEGIFPFLIFSTTDYNSVYLKGHNTSKKLNVKMSGSSYYSNFRFLGWIK